MPYEMNDAQLNAVLALPDEQRYQHFVAKVADWQELWGVRNDDGWLVPAMPEGVEYFPVWPHPEYAQKTADKNFPGHTAEELDFDTWMESMLIAFAEDNVKVAVFPNMEWRCVLADAGQLREDIRVESEQYE